MSRTSTVILVASLSVAHSASVQAAPPPSQSFAEGQLLALQVQQAVALGAGDVEHLGQSIDADFRFTDSRGRDLDRSQFLAEAGQRHEPERLPVDEGVVRLFGPVALLHALSQSGGNGGEAARIRHTYAYHWNGSEWRLVSAQDTRLADGVDWQPQRGTSPEHGSWQGQDPIGDDDQVLRALNENYVRAFREADVPWFDAHLAPDFLVVNSDGSIDDRGAALAEFAKPVFAERIRSFPVDKVRIRRFGDVAIIHAENAYELKDGRRGINRYTDVWHRQPDGRWLCVSAHITQFKAPA